MSRNIPNKPHPTPDPEKPHGPAWGDRSDLAPSVQGVPGSSDHLARQAGDPEAEEPTYDSCFDDLNVVLSQSMQEPDPDPILGCSGERPGDEDGKGPGPRPSPAVRGKAPRTSEIFRSVVAPRGGSPTPPGSSPADGPGQAEIPDLGVLDRRTASADSAAASDRFGEGKIPWGQIALLSYSTVLTLALIWLLWTGRIPTAAAPEPPAADKPAAEAGPTPAQPPVDTPAPPIPPGNIATLGQTIRLGDLEVTPLSVEARAVNLAHTIDSDARKRESDCLVLRLRLLNHSTDQAFSPLDRNLVRERDLRAIDPYIETSEGRRIRLFPLAMDSEWSIVGQDFPRLEPGQSAETFVAAEPGSARDLADEMAWRVRLRIGVYRSDMMEVKFTRSQVRRRSARSWDESE